MLIKIGGMLLEQSRLAMILLVESSPSRRSDDALFLQSREVGEVAPGQFRCAEILVTKCVDEWIG